jgi:hypothetical protein
MGSEVWRGRLLSVSLTEAAVVAREKTVTRRLGWWTDRNDRRLVRPGDRLQLCRKVMGRRPGEPLVRLALVEVTDVSRQQLWIQNTRCEAALEGFPDWSWDQFVEFFCREMRCHPTTHVTRIAWTYLDTPRSMPCP